MIWFALLPSLAFMVWHAVFYPSLKPFTFLHRVFYTLLPLVAGIVVIFSLRGLGEMAMTRDTEYWSNHVQNAKFVEPWDEKVSCSHPKYKTVTVDCGTKGNPGKKCQDKVRDGDEHDFDVDYHAPEHTVEDGSGNILTISRERFESLATKFGNRKFVEMNRDYYRVDGDAYETDWNNLDTTLVPLITTHSYENRIPVSNSIHKFPIITPEQAREEGLFDYPNVDDSYYTSSILGNGAVDQLKANRLLDIHNAKLGPRKQLRIWVLIFKNKPVQTAINQQSYWQGGNKNEFVLCIGLDSSNNVNWSQAFSWTEIEALKVEARSLVMQQRGKPLQLIPVANWLGTNLQKRFERKQFKDFEYLTVQTPTWVFLLTVFLNIAIGISTIVVRSRQEKELNRYR